MALPRDMSETELDDDRNRAQPYGDVFATKDQHPCWQRCKKNYCHRPLWMLAIISISILAIVLALALGIKPKYPNKDSRILLLADISKVDLSYTVPVGALSYTIKQGSTFYYSGLILSLEGDATAATKDKGFCMSELIQVNKTLKTYYFDESKNKETESSSEKGGISPLRVVGEFSTKIEVLKPTPNNTDALKWFSMLFGDCDPSRSKEDMFTYIKERPFSKGISIATYSTHLTLYGANFRMDPITVTLEFVYRLLEPFVNDADLLTVPYSLVTDRRDHGKVKFGFFGHTVQPAGGDINALEGVGSVHVLIFGGEETISQWDLFSPSNVILNKLFN